VLPPRPTRSMDPTGLAHSGAPPDLCWRPAPGGRTGLGDLRVMSLAGPGWLGPGGLVLLGFGALVAAQIRSYWNDDWNDGGTGTVRQGLDVGLLDGQPYGRSSRWRGLVRRC
jgi:hypothetical protein